MLVLKQGSIFFALIQLEEYPSLVEGTGLENREVEKSAQGFESLFLRQFKILISRDRAVWQLVGLITQRSLVQIRFPQPMVPWCSGLSRSPVTRKIASSNLVGTAIMASQLSWQSTRLKILVSLVRFQLKPPF